MKHILKALPIFLALTTSCVFGAKRPVDGPWLTGPIIAAPGHALKPGVWNVQPYLIVTDNNGVYNDQWRHVKGSGINVVNPFLIYGIGVFKNCDFHATLPFEYRSKHGQKSVGISDISVNVGYQIIKDEKDTWIPDLRLILKETFPTGRFKNLSASKNGTDAMGSGAFTTGFGVNFQKLFYTFGTQFTSMRLNLEYAISTKAHVRGLNTYGGSSDTDGHMKLGNAFTAVISLEQTLSRNWALAMDVQFQHVAKTRFSGTSSDPASMNSQPMDQWSLAPAIEYNLNANVGFILGAWFTVSGKNSPDFTSWVVSFTYSK
jgi:hypothetical protein